MDQWFDTYVTAIPNVQGGAPIIKGTRTSVRSIVLYLRTYHNDRSEVLQALPHLSLIEIDAAVAFYLHNRVLVDADVERHEQALRQLLTATGRPV